MFVSIFSQIIGALIALATIRMYSEFLTPNQLGEAMLVLGGMALFDAIFSSSINQVVFYYGSMPNSQTSVYQILHKYKKSALTIGIALITIISFITLYFHGFTVHTWAVLIFMLICYAIIEPSRSSLFSLLNIVSDRRTYGIQVVFDAFFTLLFTTLALYLEPSWINLLVGILTARLFSLLTNSFFLKKIFSKFDNQNQIAKIHYNKKEVLKHMKPIMFMGILGWVAGYADRYIVAGTLDVKGTGFYSIANGLVGRPYNVTTAALTAHYRPNLYSSFSTKDSKGINKIQMYWLLGAIFTGLIGAFLFFILGGQVVKLLLSIEFRGHVESLLWIMAAAMTLTISTHVFDNKFLAQGLGNRLFILQLFLLPIPLIAIGLGAFWGGVIGAAYGKLISELIKFLFTFNYSRKIAL